MWSLLSTTKEPFTIPNILPYVHHWQCSLCVRRDDGVPPRGTAESFTIPDNVVWSLLSTTKQPFTIPNILPYVHHWQCGLCCPLPKSLLQYLTSYHMSITDNVAFVVQYQSLLQYLTSYHMSITDNVAFVVHYQRAFTIPNILPYVHHWQCGLCCPLPNSLLQYLTSYHMSITDNVVFVVHYQSLLQYLTSYHMSITDNVAFVVHYQRAFYNT